MEASNSSFSLALIDKDSVLSLIHHLQSISFILRSLPSCQRELTEAEVIQDTLTGEGKIWHVLTTHWHH